MGWRQFEIKLWLGHVLNRTGVQWTSLEVPRRKTRTSPRCVRSVADCEGRLRRVELTKGHPLLRLPRGNFCGRTSAPVNGCLNPGFMTIQLDSLSTPVCLDNTPILFIAPTLTPFHSHEADLQVHCYRSLEGRLHARKGSWY